MVVNWECRRRGRIILRSGTAERSETAAGRARAVVTSWSVDNPPPYLVIEFSATGGVGTERHDPALATARREVFGDGENHIL